MIDRPTICGFCSCGCALYVEPKDGRVAALAPSARHPVSGSRLCVKGWNATTSILGADRLRTPLVRRGDTLEPATWREAISLTTDALKRFAAGSGAKSIGVIGSAKTTNEECYSLAKFARTVIGTPNVDGACRFYDASLVPALLDTTGLAASQVEINSLRDARALLVVGSNIMDQLGHLVSRIEDAVADGCVVVTVDPRRSRFAVHTSQFLHPKPGTDLAWLRAMLRTILDRRLYVDGAPEMPGFEELRSSLADLDPSALAGVCGLEPSAIAEAAETLALDRPLVVMFGLGVFQQAGSTEIIKALADVAMLLGGSVMPLRGQNNAQGSCDMGLLQGFLPGYMRIPDAAARSHWDRAWNCKLEAEPGMSAVEMIRGCGSGEIKALLVFGDNVALSAPNTEETLLALDRVEFLAVADLYLTETARLADVVFPACSFLEKDGTFTSIERRVQRVRKAFEPIGESKSDLDIAADLAAALGANLSRSPAEVMAEIAANVPQYADVSYAALDETWGTPWPANGRDRRLVRVSELGPESAGDYPFRLIASRINFHQQTGTLAARSHILTREYPEAFVEMNEADSDRLRLRPGSMVTVTSASGSLTRRLSLSADVPVGCVHAPHFFGGDSPNTLTSYECDPISGVPVYKGLAVNVEAAIRNSPG